MRDVDDFLDDVDDLLDDEDWEWGTDAARWSPAVEADDTPWETRSPLDVLAEYGALMERTMVPIRDAYRRQAAMYAQSLDALFGAVRQIEWREPDLPTRQQTERVIEQIRDHAGYDLGFITVDETHDWSPEMMRRASSVAAEIAEQHAARPPAGRITYLSTAGD